MDNTFCHMDNTFYYRLLLLTFNTISYIAPYPRPPFVLLLTSFQIWTLIQVAALSSLLVFGTLTFPNLFSNVPPKPSAVINTLSILNTPSHFKNDMWFYLIICRCWAGLRVYFCCFQQSTPLRAETEKYHTFNITYKLTPLYILTQYDLYNKI